MTDQPMPPAKKSLGAKFKTATRQQQALGCIALLFICGLCTWVFQSGSKSQPGQEAEAPLRNRTAAAIAPKPTEAEEATATVEPTSKPEPTDTELAAVPPDVADYMGWAMKEANTIGESITTLGEQATAAGESPVLILSNEWRIKTAGSLAVMSLAADEIRKRSDVPAEAQNLHAVMLQMADELDSVATNFAEGLDENNTDKIAVASKSLQLLGQLAKQATTEVNEMQKRYDQ